MLYALLGCAGVAILASLSLGCTNMPTNPQTDQACSIESILRDHLHAEGSGAEAIDLLSDEIEIYVDDGRGKPFPAEILPFRHYYSSSQDLTVSICALGLTVFVCPSRVAFPLEKDDVPPCAVASGYAYIEGLIGPPTSERPR